MSTSLFSQSTAIDQEPVCIPRSLLFGNPLKTYPLLSADGKQLGYLAPNEKNVLNVWVKDLEQPEKADRIVTSEEKQPIRQFIWQFDGEHILYIQDHEGNENGHLFQTDIKTKITKDLTPFEGVKVDILSYNSNFPKTLLIQMNHRNKQLFDVYRVDLETGQVELEAENKQPFIDWTVDHELQVRAAQSYKKDGSTVIHVRDTLDSPWRELLVINFDEIGGEIIEFSPDNGSLYLLSSIGGNTGRLLEIDIQTGKQKILAEDSQYDIDNVLIHPTTYQIEAAGVNREKPEWILLNNQMSSDFEKIKKIIQGPFKIFSRDLKDQKWVIASFSDKRPVHFYLYDRPQQKLNFLFSTQPNLEEFELSEMNPVMFHARDGMQLFGYLTLPLGKVPKQLPTILFVHGGPWVRDSWGLNASVQWLANRGYAVLQINYRGSTGYGKKYLNAGNREWAGKMHTDLLDGKQWLINQGYANPHKVAIYGGSYGGYATLVGLTFTPDAFCCGIDVVGPSNLMTLLQTIPPYWAPLKAQTDLRLGSLDDVEFLKERSPLYKAKQITKPLLIGQGANDPRVKQAESDQIVDAMRQNQLPVEYLLFKDEGHGFAKPHNRLKFFAAAEAFLAKYLGGKYQPPSAEEEWESLRK